MRVVALTLGIPAGLALFGLTASGGLMARFGAARPAVDAELAILVAVSTAAGAGGLALRLPGGLMFGAMLGVRHPARRRLHPRRLPWWVAAPR